MESEAALLSECGRDSDALAWTVVHTHPSAETWAARNLDLAGYETYLPLYAALSGFRRVSPGFAGKQRQLVERPLFPGYLFLGLEPGQGWVAAQYCPGVHKLCTFAGRPSVAPTAAVEALQAGESDRRCLPPPGSLWRPGAPCRLANGSPLDGIDAVVISISGDSARVHVLMFGELREVVVKAECLMGRVSV